MGTRAGSQGVCDGRGDSGLDETPCGISGSGQASGLLTHEFRIKKELGFPLCFPSGSPASVAGSSTAFLPRKGDSRNKNESCVCVCAHACSYVCADVWAHVYPCAHVCVYVHCVHMHVWVCACMSACVCMLICVCMPVHMCADVHCEYMHVCVHACVHADVFFRF